MKNEDVCRSRMSLVQPKINLVRTYLCLRASAFERLVAWMPPTHRSTHQGTPKKNSLSSIAIAMLPLPASPSTPSQVAYLCEFDLITDFAGSMNFVLIAVLSLYLGGA